MNKRNNRFTKTLPALLAMLVMAFTGVATAQDDGDTLKVLTVPEFVPFEVIDQETGEMTGFDMDILAEVADRAGFDYELNTMAFKGIIPALQTGSADAAIAATTITDTRAEVVDFTIPYYQSGLRIMVRSDNDTIEDMDDLEGLSISTKIGSTSYDYLTDKFGDDADIKPYDTTAQMYMALLSGNVEASVYDAPNVSYYVKTKSEGRAKTVGPLYEAQPYGIVFTQGSEWVEPANEALQSMKDDGTYAEIYKKWFGKLPPEDD